MLFTGDDFVWSIPVGDLGEVSQDLGGLLRLGPHVGRDGVTHCEYTNKEGDEVEGGQRVDPTFPPCDLM